METIIIEKRTLEEITSRLDKISSLLALSLVSDCKNQTEKVLMLSSFGYGVTEIAKMLGTTVGTANQALVRSRKKGATGKNEEIEDQGEEANTVE